MEKKLLFKIIILLSLFLFSGCGKKETIASYSKIMIGIEEDEAITCTFMEENAYLYCVDHNGVTEIYEAGYSGTEKNRILEKCGDLVVLDISRNSQGEILLLGMPRNSRDNLYLYLYDIQENLISKSSVSETVGGEGINLCVDAEGNVAVAGRNNSVYLFDKEGKYQFSVQGFDVLAGVESDGEHTFYAAGYSTSNYVIKSFSVSEEGDKKEFTKTPAANFGCGLFFSPKGGIGINSGTALYNMDKDGSSKEIVSLVEMGISADNIIGIRQREDDSFVILVSKVKNEDIENQAIVLKVGSEREENSKKEKQIITLATVFLDSDMREQIIEFNNSDKEYEIVIDDYSRYDLSTAIQRMSTDITAGKIPDIIDCNFSNTRTLISKGLLQDLVPYIENDAEIDTKDLVTNVLDAEKLDGKLYTMITGFNVRALLSSEQYAKETRPYTMEELRKRQEETGYPMIGGISKEYMLLYGIIYNEKNFIDWEKQEVSFNNPDFINLLELCKEYPDNPDSIEEKKAENLIKDNKEIYIPALIDTAYAYEAYQLLFDRNIGLTGFPVESGNGISEVSAGGLAMSSQSEHKEGVWRFLRTLLQDDYQIKRSKVEFPISRKILMKTLEEIQNEKYYKGEDGEAVKILQETLSYGGTEYPVYAISEETSTEILDLISKVDGTDHYDLEVWNIIQEEAEIFFSGNKTAPEVAEVIQNRVTIYLKEIEKHITF